MGHRKQLRSTLHSAAALGVVAAITLVVGCAETDWNWDWFGAKKQPARPQTRASASDDRAKPAEAPRTAGGQRGADADDARAREVDQKVDQYVASMNPRYAPSYESNDFSSKMRRQQDPERASRIQQTAARQRSADGGAYSAQPVSPAAGSSAGDSHGDSADRPRAADVDRQTDSTGPVNGAASSEQPSSAQPGDTDAEPQIDPQSPGDMGMTGRQSPGGDTPRESAAAERPVETRAVTSGEPVAASKPPTVSNIAARPADESPAPQGQPDHPRDVQRDGGDGSGHARAIDGQADHASGDVSPRTPPKRPPVITELKVDATDSASGPAATGDSTAAADVATADAARSPATSADGQASVDTLKARIAEQEARVAEDPNNIEEQFRLRILYLADGQDEKALAASDGINADVLEIMRAQLTALMAARSTAQRDPATWANRQYESIEKLRALLAERADLKVTKVVICRAIAQFGQYDPIEPAVFRAGAGSRMLLYVPIENFKCERTESGQYRTLLSIRFSLIDADGKEKWSDKVDNVEDLSRDRRSDFFFGWPENGLPIPKALGPGEYTIKVEVEDVLAQKINSNTTTFKLVP